MKTRYRSIQRILTAAVFAAFIHHASAETQYITLGGPATGYLAVSNMKNAVDQAGILGSNGLPSYPYYVIPAGQTNAGRYTAVIASPQFAGADYSPLYAYGGVNPGDVTVNNLTITDANYSTMSAGLIGFDSSLLTGAGIETIGVSSLTFNLNTYQWDGKTASGWDTNSPIPWKSAANGWDMEAGTIGISPFSPVYTDYNYGGGAGNAAGFYTITLSNVTGGGLTFQDGTLTSMDIDADLSVVMRIGNFPTLGSLPFEGTFSADGLNYTFALDDTNSVAVFSNVHMIMNREGTASVVPEPSSVLLLSLGLAAAVARRRR